jgi:membrane-associated protein
MESILQAGGYLGLFLIVYAESGFLIGFILPGDSLLFTAGFLASQNILNLALVIPTILVAAVLGDNTGYLIGKKFGHRVFRRKDAKFLNPQHIKQAEAFYKKHGGKAIILARYVPVVRTLAPLLAGVGSMAYASFITFDLIGCLLWSFGITILGYYLGQTIPNIDHYLLPAILLVILISIVPSIIHFARAGDLRRFISRFKRT